LGDDLAARYIEDVAIIQTRQSMGYPTEGVRHTAAGAAKQQWEAWGKQAGDVVKDAVEMGHPLLTAAALMARLTALLGVLQMQRLNALADGTTWDPSEATLRGLMGEAEQAIQIYRRAGNVEGESRAKLLLADLFDLTGQEQAAKALAEGVLPAAQAMNYGRLEEHAREYIAGQTAGLARIVPALAEGAEVRQAGRPTGYSTR